MNKEFLVMVAELEAMKEEIMNKGRDTMAESFKKTFEIHPEVKAISWEQYTPYFNDGESCEFGVNDFSIVTADVDVAEDVLNGIALEAVYGEYYGKLEDDDNIKVLSSYKDKTKTYADIWDISSFAQSSIGEDLFGFLFGDHSKVIVTREGIDVVDYEHD